MTPMSLSPPEPTSPATTPVPTNGGADPDAAAGAPLSRGFLSRSWALPVWAWLLGGAALAALIVGLIVTRPEDDSQQVTDLQEQLAAEDAALAQSQADAQQQTFDDVQEVRDEAERQLSDAASAREQAEQASELSTQKYTDLIAFEITRVQADAVAQACSAADAAGYAQAAKPDPSSFGAAAAAGLPDDASTQVLVALDQAAISAKVDECYQTGSARYTAQTTTTTTVAPEPPVDTSLIPTEAG